MPRSSHDSGAFELESSSDTVKKALIPEAFTPEPVHRKIRSAMYKDHHVFSSPSRNRKIILLGNLGVGKSSLVEWFKKEGFRTATHEKCSSSDRVIWKIVRTKACPEGGKVEIWDTNGQERYTSISGLFFRDTHACILVYDVHDQQSFQSLQLWKMEMLKQSRKSFEENEFRMFIIGNKADLPYRTSAVRESEAQAFADESGICFLGVVSAKTGKNVKKVFIEIIEQSFTIHDPEEK